MGRIDILAARRARQQERGEPPILVLPLTWDGDETVDLALVPEITLAMSQLANGTDRDLVEMMRALLADPSQMDDPKVLAAVLMLSTDDVDQMMGEAYGQRLGESPGSKPS